jgi:hypothetical protein
MDDAVESALESQPVPSTYEAPNFELEQQRLAVEHSLSALLQFSLLATRQVASTGARFSAEIRAALNQIAADAPAGTRLAGVGDLPIADAIVRVRGVLNGINSVLQLTDESRRTQLFAAQLNVRDVANVSRTVLGLAEGIVAMTSLIGSGVAQLRGNAPLAAQLLRLGTGTVVQRISWAANLAQVIHGFSVLLDNRATESDRVQGVFDVAMGSAGLTGAAATLGVETLRGLAGPLSAGIVVTAGEIVYLRNLIRGMEEGMATAGIVQSFDIVEYEAGVVAHSANELAQAIAYASTAAQDTQSGGAPGELAGAAQREVNLRRRRLRETMFRAIERVTQRQPDFAILFQPASWPRVSQPFQALYASLQQAHTSDDLLMVASTYLARARALFRHLTEAIVRTLQDTDRSRAGGVLPSVLGGLHDERRGQGGRTDTLWSEP